MIPVTFTYPFDPTGGAVSNLVPEETHNISPVNGADFRFIVPKAAPYFLTGMKLYHTATNVELIRGQDWVPGHALNAIKNNPPYLDVYGSILLLNNNLSGAISVKPYQTIGGEYTLDEQTLLTVLANVKLDPRTAYWEDVKNAPLVMDPLAHLHNASDTVGYGALVVALQDLVTRFVSENSNVAQMVTAHKADNNNPHGVSLTTLGIQHLATTKRAELEEIINGSENLNYTSPDNVRRAIDAAITTLQLLGAEGDVPFHKGTGKNFDVSMGLTRSRLGIVDTAADLTVQLAARESFATVLNEWTRVAMKNNNLQGVPSELTSWSYDSPTDRLISTVNSTSLLGLYSPEKVLNDYTFEVELSSTSADADWIGVGLGIEAYGSKTRNLTLIRNATAAPTVKLVYDYNGANEVTLAELTGLTGGAGGWAAYSTAVKLRVRRVGNNVYFTSNVPGGAYLPEKVFDLNSRPETRVFMAAVNLGYVCFSQDRAAFKTLQRTGANLPIIALHTQQVHLWTGSAYTLSSETPSTRLTRGRFWYNPVTKTTWYSSATGQASLVSTATAQKMMSTTADRLDRVVATTSAGVTLAGKELSLLNAGKSGGMNVDSTGVLNFIGNAGTALAYFDTTGKLRHWGVDHLSDSRLKENITLLHRSKGLGYYSWVWKDHPVVPDHIVGTVGYGVIAQEVQALYPQFVTEGSDGFMAVAEDKLALFLSMRPSWIYRVVAKVLSYF